MYLKLDSLLYLATLHEIAVFYLNLELSYSTLNINGILC